MTPFQSLLAVTASVLCAVLFLFPFALTAEAALSVGAFPMVAMFAVVAIISCARFRYNIPLWVDGVVAVFGVYAVLAVLPKINGALVGFWLSFAAVWLFSWLFAERLAAAERGEKTGISWASNVTRLIIPLLFGIMLLVVWEVITRAGNVSQVLLPPPSSIGARIASSLPVLRDDFQQTVLKAVLFGYVVGCGAGFAVAVAVDKSRFLRHGLLPLGNFVSAMPIIGIAPIMVMWFGFDWQSKAAVVIVMTFFPMLVNTVAGLNAAHRMERDLMNTYAANYWHVLVKLQLPAAAPFIFNALKINSTLALIGAIVAEFFGTPIVGMGFRISTEVGRMNLDMVWAEIAMAALTGSVFYGALALLERRVTFWHPSVRRG